MTHPNAREHRRVPHTTKDQLTRCVLKVPSSEGSEVGGVEDLAESF